MSSLRHLYLCTNLTPFFLISSSPLLFISPLHQSPLTSLSFCSAFTPFSVFTPQHFLFSCLNPIFANLPSAHLFTPYIYPCLSLFYLFLSSPMKHFQPCFQLICFSSLLTFHHYMPFLLSAFSLLFHLLPLCLSHCYLYTPCFPFFSAILYLPTLFSFRFSFFHHFSCNLSSISLPPLIIFFHLFSFSVILFPLLF